MYKYFSCLVLFVFAPLAFAHHSMAEYDFDTTQELQGQVARFSWRNPHVELTLSVKDVSGVETLWEIEAQDINTMSRRGLNATMISVGDNVRVAGHSSQRRPNNMSVTNLLLPNGIELRFRGNPEPRWGAEENLGFGSQDVAEILAAVDIEAGKSQGLFRVWMRARSGGFPAELPLTNSSLVYRENWTEADDPNIECRVPGMPSSMRLSPPHPIKILEQEDGNIVVHIEFFDVFRTVHMNANAELANQPVSAQGYSVGHWEDDVLVVNTSRIDWPFFDNMAKIPQSDAITTYERYELNEDGTQMAYELTVTDPFAFTEPVTGSWLMDWRPDMEMQEYDCIPPEDD
jgi:hypothetical protein